MPRNLQPLATILWLQVAGLALFLILAIEHAIHQLKETK
jgi:hypothetical protein